MTTLELYWAVGIGASVLAVVLLFCHHKGWID